MFDVEIRSVDRGDHVGGALDAGDVARVFKEGEATQSAKSTFVKFGKIEETFKYTRDNLKEEYYQTQLVYITPKDNRNILF